MLRSIWSISSLLLGMGILISGSGLLGIQLALSAQQISCTEHCAKRVVDFMAQGSQQFFYCLHLLFFELHLQHLLLEFLALD